MNLRKINLDEAKRNFTPSHWTKYFVMFSATIILVGAIMLLVCGFNLGMDFTGGNVLSVESSSEISTSEYTNIVEKAKTILNEQGLKLSQSQIVGESGKQSVSIQYQNKDGVSDMSEINSAVVTALKEALPTYDVANAETKSASASAELLTNALLAVFVALIFILIYIAIRFEFLSGIAAMLTLFHDVLIMCACVLIFRIEINSSFVAAVITILGYSINNTIIVFDRVRENLSKPSLDELSNKQIADLSIKQTLNRTLNTSITTILAIFMLALIGVPQMSEFVIPILIGLVAGTYASVFISAPLWSAMMSKSTKLGGIRQRAHAKAEREKQKTAMVDAPATAIEE